jgi:alpha-ketoglutarate-dependent taurine dioxygenase
MPEARTNKVGEFPFLMRTSGPLSKVAESQRDEINARLTEVGAVLLRGCNFEGAHDFREFVRTLSGKEFLGYAGGASPRKRSGLEGIYNSTEYPPDLHLALHNDMSYSAIYPHRLYFLCEREPSVGGETTFGDSRRILRSVPTGIVEEMKARGICYIRNLNPRPGTGYSWAEAFNTKDREEVEVICRSSGADYSWECDSTLRLRQNGPATIRHPKTGEEVWFNQAAGFYAGTSATHGERPRLECTFADGAEIPPEFIERIRSVLEQQEVPHRWQRSDVIILDNILAAHGRMPFQGERRIMLAMT